MERTPETSQSRSVEDLYAKFEDALRLIGMARSTARRWKDNDLDGIDRNFMSEVVFADVRKEEHWEAL